MARSLRLPVLTPLQRNKCTRIVEFVTVALWPLKKRAHVNDDLPFGVQLNMRAIHRSRRRAFKVDRLIVVAAAMTRTFEFVFARLPIGRASQVRAAGVDNEQSTRGLVHP